MRQNIKINIDVGATSLLKIDLLKKARGRMHKQFISYLLPFLMNTNTSETT